MIESLLLRNLSWIRGIARTFCRNRDDAEYLAGDTILKVLLNENETRIPLKEVTGPYYKWSDFRSYFLQKLDNFKI